MLNLYRRHVKSCPHTERHQTRCQCPVWVDGTHEGKRRHHTLDTRDMATARRTLAQIESGALDAVEVPPLAEMAASWLDEVESRGLAKGTIDKVRQDVKALLSFTDANGITNIAEFDLATFRRYRDSWKMAAITVSRRLQRTRQMWRFFLDHQWTATNPAIKVKPPKVEGKPKKPYEDWEIAALLAAVDRSKRMTDYERRRMTSFLHVLRYTGLRISDAVQLTPRQVQNGKIRLHQAKTAEAVSVLVPPLVINALAAIQDGDKPYFWSGNGKVRTRTANFSRTLSRIGKAAGVEKPSPHRFRTTFAVALLTAGTSVERVAKLLGHKDSSIVEKHYAPWVKALQDALDEDLRRVYSQEFATPVLREQEKIN